MNTYQIFRGLLFLDGHLTRPEFDPGEDLFAPSYGNKVAAEREFKPRYATPKPAFDARECAAGCG